MVTTVARIIERSTRFLSGVNSADPLTPNLEAEAVAQLQAMILSLPGMTHWINVDTDADYTAGANERIRVTTLDDIIVTVPDAFASSSTVLWCCNQTTLRCEGYSDRAPKDGERVAISDQFSDDQAMFYFRADIAQWTRADGLARDSEIPLNADFDEALAAMLAMRLAPASVTSVAAMIAAEGRSRMRARFGKRQEIGGDPVLLNTYGRRGVYS
jgi:hypothetical protein